MISENVWSTQNLVLGDGSAWRTGWGTEAGSIKGPQGWLGSTSNGYYAKFCNSRVLVVCEDTDACCSESNDTPTDSPTAKPNAVQCEQPDSASVCFPEAKVLCASNVGYREQICPYMCGTCNVPYAESAGIQCEIPDSTTMCFSSAAVLCKDNVNYRDEICPFMCGTCTKAYSSNNSLPTPAPTPPSVSPPSPTPAPDAAWELPQGCPEWCVEDVTKGKKPASEVCDMAKCKTCTFPDSEVTCSSDAATPPSPTPAPAGTCKGWCSTDFDKGTSTDTLCGFKACTGCVFSDNSSCSGRRARWVQPCEQMSAIECMTAILEGQCMLQSDAVGKRCIDVNLE